MHLQAWAAGLRGDAALVHATLQQRRTGGADGGGGAPLRGALGGQRIGLLPPAPRSAAVRLPQGVLPARLALAALTPACTENRRMTAGTLPRPGILTP